MTRRPRWPVPLHPILRQSLHLNKPVGNQRGHAVGKQLIQQLLIVDAEVAECVVVDPNPATQPAVGQVSFTASASSRALPTPSIVA